MSKLSYQAEESSIEKSGTCTANFGGDVPEVSMHLHQFR